MRRAVAAGVLVASVLFAGPATADLRRSDPDDNDGIDISFARSAVSGTPVKLRFAVGFYEDIVWDELPGIFFIIDSRGGRRLDYVLQIRRVNAGFQCRLTDLHGKYIARLRGPIVRGDAVACRLRRNVLRTDGTAIRWGVSATYRRGPFTEGDDAPDHGYFFPHV